MISNAVKIYVNISKVVAVHNRYIHAYSHNFSWSCSRSCCCPDSLSCDICPDFIIRRHDTQPPFRVSVENCDGPIELEGSILEVNMWANGRLKNTMGAADTYSQLADIFWFLRRMIGDIIILDRVRQPEHMLVTGFDEDNYFIRYNLQRGYNGGHFPGN